MVEMREELEKIEIEMKEMKRYAMELVDKVKTDSEA